VRTPDRERAPRIRVPLPLCLARGPRGRGDTHVRGRRGAHGRAHARGRAQEHDLRRRAAGASRLLPTRRIGSLTAVRVRRLSFLSPRSTPRSKRTSRAHCGHTRTPTGTQPGQFFTCTTALKRVQRVHARQCARGRRARPGALAEHLRAARRKAARQARQLPPGLHRCVDLRIGDGRRLCSACCFPLSLLLRIFLLRRPALPCFLRAALVCAPGHAPRPSV
jgi:hypothetical protein